MAVSDEFKLNSKLKPENYIVNWKKNFDENVVTNYFTSFDFHVYGYSPNRQDDVVPISVFSVSDVPVGAKKPDFRTTGLWTIRDNQLASANITTYGSFPLIEATLNEEFDPTVSNPKIGTIKFKFSVPYLTTQSTKDEVKEFTDLINLFNISKTKFKYPKGGTIGTPYLYFISVSSGFITPNSDTLDKDLSERKYTDFSYVRRVFSPYFVTEFDIDFEKSEVSITAEDIFGYMSRKTYLPVGNEFARTMLSSGGNMGDGYDGTTRNSCIPEVQIADEETHFNNRLSARLAKAYDIFGLLCHDSTPSLLPHKPTGTVLDMSSRYLFEIPVFLPWSKRYGDSGRNFLADRKLNFKRYVNWFTIGDKNKYKKWLRRPGRKDSRHPKFFATFGLPSGIEETNAPEDGTRQNESYGYFFPVSTVDKTDRTMLQVLYQNCQAQGIHIFPRATRIYSGVDYGDFKQYYRTLGDPWAAPYSLQRGTSVDEESLEVYKIYPHNMYGNPRLSTLPDTLSVNKVVIHNWEPDLTTGNWDSSVTEIHHDYIFSQYMNLIKQDGEYHEKEKLCWLYTYPEPQLSIELPNPIKLYNNPNWKVVHQSDTPFVLFQMVHNATIERLNPISSWYCATPKDWDKKGTSYFLPSLDGTLKSNSKNFMYVCEDNGPGLFRGAFVYNADEQGSPLVSTSYRLLNYHAAGVTSGYTIKYVTETGPTPPKKPSKEWYLGYSDILGMDYLDGMGNSGNNPELVRAAIRDVQERLAKLLKIVLEVDGKFGSKTADAVYLWKSSKRRGDPANMRANWNPWDRPTAIDAWDWDELFYIVGSEGQPTVTTKPVLVEQNYSIGVMIFPRTNFWGLSSGLSTAKPADEFQSLFDEFQPNPYTLCLDKAMIEKDRITNNQHLKTGTKWDSVTSTGNHKNRFQLRKIDYPKTTTNSNDNSETRENAYRWYSNNSAFLELYNISQSEWNNPEGAYNDSDINYLPKFDGDNIILKTYPLKDTPVERDFREELRLIPTFTTPQPTLSSEFIVNEVESKTLDNPYVDNEVTAKIAQRTAHGYPYHKTKEMISFTMRNDPSLRVGNIVKVAYNGKFARVLLTKMNRVLATKQTADCEGWLVSYTNEDVYDLTLKGGKAWYHFDPELNEYTLNVIWDYENPAAYHCTYVDYKVKAKSDTVWSFASGSNATEALDIVFNRNGDFYKYYRNIQTVIVEVTSQLDKSKEPKVYRVTIPVERDDTYLMPHANAARANMGTDPNLPRK